MEFPKSENYNLIDYGLNVHILKSTWYADDNYSSRKISGDKAPSKRFLIMDSYRNTTNKTQGFWRISINTSAEFLGNTNWAQPAGRHDGKVNMLYLDFHVGKERMVDQAELVTVAVSRGSTPREAGAMMAVFSGGAIAKSEWEHFYGVPYPW